MNEKRVELGWKSADVSLVLDIINSRQWSGIQGEYILQKIKLLDMLRGR